MRRTRLPPATPDRIAAIEAATDTLETLVNLFRITGQSTQHPPATTDWLAGMAFAQLEEIRSAIQ